MIILQTTDRFIPWLTVAQEIAVAGIVAGLLLTLLLNRLILRRICGKVIASWVDRFPLFDILPERDSAIIKWIEIVIGLIVTTIATLAILSVSGVDVGIATARIERFSLTIARWLGTHGLRIAIIVTLAYSLPRMVGRVFPPLIRTALLRGKDGIELEEAAKRAIVLGQVSNYVTTIVVFLTATIMILSELNFNLGPILAGVGVVGIALGFGAQHLVRDVISGVFILAENQYRVGDVASVGGKVGLVEAVNLRRTILRDLDGIVHMIPNGEITMASNYTKGYSRVNLDISVAYKEDLDHVIRVLNRVGATLTRDEYFGPLIIDPPQVLRVTSFDESGITVKIVGVTKPIRQWEVTGELRRRIKREFDLEGIEIPFPHQTIYWGDGSHPRSEPAPQVPSKKHTIGEDLADIEGRPHDPWASQLNPSTLLANTPSHVPAKGPLKLMAHLGEVRNLLHHTPIGLITDIDGTLARIAPRPNLAKITPAVRQALGVLSSRMTVVALSGRNVASAKSIIGLNSITYIGNHGMETWAAGHTSVIPEARPLVSQIHRLAKVVKAGMASHKGLLIEDKSLCLAIHYRKTNNPAMTRDAILALLKNVPEAQDLTIREGKMVVEIRLPLEVDKGTALKSIVEQHGLKSAVVIGDDLTDLDTFQMLVKLRKETDLYGITIAVQAGHTPPSLLEKADYTLMDTEMVEIFLSWLAEESTRM